MNNKECNFLKKVKKGKEPKKSKTNRVCLLSPV